MSLIRKITACAIYLTAYLICMSLIASFGRIGTEHSFTVAFMIGNILVVVLVVITSAVFAACKAIEWAYKELKL